MRTIAIVNQKGGCGKTTTAINLAAIYARRGLRTLVVDMDPQSHCALGLGVPEDRVEFSIGDALIADHLSEAQTTALFWEVSRNLHLAPSTMRLAGLESPGGGLHARADRDRRLELLLGRVVRRFDRCLIDCPPTVGLLTFNALRAAREALIPVETGYFALRGADKQWKTIQRVIKHIGRPIACHLVATMHREESSVACGILQTLRRQFAGQIVPVVIREHAVLREAASFGQPIIEYAPGSAAQTDFEQLVDWLEDHAAEPSQGAPIEVVAGTHAACLTGGTHSGAPQPAMAASNTNDQGEMAATSPHLPMVGGGSTATLVVSLAADIAGARGGAIAEAPAGSRAAELARRVSVLSRKAPATMPTELLQSDRSDLMHVMAPTIATEELRGSNTAVSDIVTDRQSELRPVSSADATARSVRHSEPSTTPDARTEAAPSIATEADRKDQHPGVRCAHGVVTFRQPGRTEQRLALAGDFNNWSGAATPMIFDAATNTHGATLTLPAGSYRYRVIIDGQWQIDRYNHLTHMNESRETNSLLVVPEREARP